MQGAGRVGEAQSTFCPRTKVHSCLEGQELQGAGEKNTLQGSPIHRELSALEPSVLPYVGQYINYVGKGTPVSPPLFLPSECSKRQAKGLPWFYRSQWQLYTHRCSTQWHSG